MKLRASLLLAFAVALGAAGVVHAGGEKRHSCQKALARANEAIQAFQKRGDSVIKAEIGSGPIGAKVALEATVDDGEYTAFAVGERGAITQLELACLDASGKDLKPHSKAVDECLCDGVAVDKKQAIKLQVEVVDTAEQGSQVADFVIVLMGKKQPTEQLDFLFDYASKQVKEMEGEGYDVDWGVFDTLSADKPWALTRKLAAGSYRVDGVSDDNSVKDLQLELKDASGSLGKDARTDHIATLKGDSKGGEGTVAVSAAFAEGAGKAFAGVLVARKP